MQETSSPTYTNPVCAFRSANRQFYTFDENNGKQCGTRGTCYLSHAELTHSTRRTSMLEFDMEINAGFDTYQKWRRGESLNHHQHKHNEWLLTPGRHDEPLKTYHIPHRVTAIQMNCTLFACCVVLSSNRARNVDGTRHTLAGWRWNLGYEHNLLFVISIVWTDYNHHCCNLKRYVMENGFSSSHGNFKLQRYYWRSSSSKASRHR